MHVHCTLGYGEVVSASLPNSEGTRNRQMHWGGKKKRSFVSLFLPPMICDVIRSETTIPGRCSRQGELIEPSFAGKSTLRVRRRRPVMHAILNSVSLPRETAHDVCVRQEAPGICRSDILTRARANVEFPAHAKVLAVVDANPLRRQPCARPRSIDIGTVPGTYVDAPLFGKHDFE